MRRSVPIDEALAPREQDIDYYMLYLIATPIGNLGDITLRALEILKSCDYILCEDTRHSRHLLKFHGIDRPLKSYHRFNEQKALNPILEDLKKELKVGLISDAGTPILCDPGHLLLSACYKENLPVTMLPGPSALMMALSLSGLPPFPFQFLGFVPKKKKELEAFLKKNLTYPGTSLAYDTPHQILDTLTVLHELSPHRLIVLLRELTKIHEERLAGTPQELLTHFESHPPKGEFVLLISPPAPEDPSLPHLSPEEHVALLQKEGLSLKEAIKAVAKARKLPKQVIYQLFHH